jgi:hypothetical protein
MQFNTLPMTFQDTFEVVVTLLSGRIGRERENVVAASEDGIEDTMNLGNTIDANSSMDQNLPPPTKQIHNVYTRKSHHENVEQLLVPVDDSPTTQTPSNLELPLDTLLSDLDLPIIVRKEVRSIVLEQKKGASISHVISFETLPRTYKAFTTSLHSNYVPCDWRDAMRDLKWKKAMFKEMGALVKNDIWDMVPRSSDKNTVRCK